MSLQADLNALMVNAWTKVPDTVLAPIDEFYRPDLRKPGLFPNALREGQRKRWPHKCGQ